MLSASDLFPLAATAAAGAGGGAETAPQFPAIRRMCFPGGTPSSILGGYQYSSSFSAAPTAREAATATDRIRRKEEIWGNVVVPKVIQNASDEGVDPILHK